MTQVKWDTGSRKKRSRGGCSSCKKLKIKCNEAKPSCEYCVATNRKCIYMKDTPNSLILSKRKDNVTWGNNEELTAIYDFLTERQFSSLGSSYELILNNPSSMMLITPFEMKLLKFFDIFCINLLSFGVNKSTEDMWRRVAPIYFFRSNLLRQSIYSFSSLILWPVTETKALSLSSPRETQDNSASETWNAVCKRFDQDPCLNREAMFMKVTEYFLNTVREKMTSIGKLANPTLSFEEKITSAVEMNLSGALIFGFLGMHSYGLMPLLSLDGVLKHDFLSICQGISAHRDFCMAEIPEYAPKFHWLTLNESFQKVALTAVLKRQVIEYYQEEQIDSTRSDEFQLCLIATVKLETLITTATQQSYPLPVFIWPLMIDRSLIDKMRDFNLMPLRLLYVYACLCHFAGFSMDEQSNIWIDYAKWFKELNYDIFGTWKYELDSGLYELLEKKYRIRTENINDLMTLLPS